MKGDMTASPISEEDYIRNKVKKSSQKQTQQTEWIHRQSHQNTQQRRSNQHGNGEERKKAKSNRARRKYGHRT